MTMQAELSDVIYNAADQAFEALVTIPTGSGPLRYAASFPAPITTQNDAASQGLIARAHKMHALNTGMRAGIVHRLTVSNIHPITSAKPTRWLDTWITRARAA